MLLPSTSIGASFQSQVLAVVLDRADHRGQLGHQLRVLSTSQTASRGWGTTAVERLEAEKTVMAASLVDGSRRPRAAPPAPRQTGAMDERNWAGNLTYRGAAGRAADQHSTSSRSWSPARERVRALGSRHSFTDLTDTDGRAGLARRPPAGPRRSTSRRGTVTVGAGARTTERWPRRSSERGWALANLASLPHISVGRRGRHRHPRVGRPHRSLASAVAAIELVGAGRRAAHGARAATPTSRAAWSRWARSASSPG